MAMNPTPADLHLMVYRSFVDKVGGPMSDRERAMLDHARDTWDAAAAAASPESQVSHVVQSLVPKNGPYDTPLSPADVDRYAAWKMKNAPTDSGADYDLQGAFLAGITPDAKTGHMPDTWKKPNHPTFSDESKYARSSPREPGHWKDGVFIPARGQAGPTQR